MLVLQHDFILVRPFDAAGLLRTMAAYPAVKHVRLNARANIATGFDGYIANHTGFGYVAHCTEDLRSTATTHRYTHRHTPT